MLEVCIDNLESAENAVVGGADELEVCSMLLEGGLTPSPGLVKEVLCLVNNHYTVKQHKETTLNAKQETKQKTKVNVMIRCRGGSDFCYNDKEMQTMLSDINIFKSMQVDRFVFGALTEEQEIDELLCEKVISQAYPVPVTFHRAFDLCNNPEDSLSKIIKLGFTRVLSSGQRSSVEDDDAKNLLKKLLFRYGDHIEIMPGAGINCKNAKAYIDLGCKIVHSSCKHVKLLPNSKPALDMGSSEVYISDKDIVQKIKRIINEK